MTEGQEPDMSVDEQEALSIKYGWGLFITKLSSGNWAIFGPDRKLLLISPTLREDLLAEMCQQEEGKYKVEAERLGLGQGSLVATKSAEELGL